MISLETPVLFLVFNRPHTTRQVFDVIRSVKPKQLFVAADGPRDDKEGEKDLCREVREIAIQVDWDCELKTLFRNENLGCGKAVSEAINWFFDKVEMGVILEDDCLPDPSFFYYCQELLEKYLRSEKVMNISGNNLQNRSIEDYSYYFSKYNHTWGWATWKRAWKNYQYNIFEEDVSTFNNWLHSLSMTKEEITYWKNIYSSLIENYNTWDYQWLFTVWKFKGVSITPKVNLVSNIGFGKGATHTKDTYNPFSGAATYPIELPLKHPPSTTINKKLDLLFVKSFFGLVEKITLRKRVNQKIRRIYASILPEKISDTFPKLLGIPKKEISRLRKSKAAHDSSIIYDTSIKISDPFWHLHSLQEIFIDEVYKFRSDTNKPQIIDCGANIGLSVLYFKKLYPMANIIAFEPDKSIFRMLCENVTSFKLEDVSLVNKAVWTENTQLKFLATGAVSGKIYLDTLDQQQSGLEIIDCVKLKSYLTSPIDFLKIDIEGAEYEVIRDCKEVLHNVKNLFVEYHSDPKQPQALADLLIILKESGFRVYIKEAWNNMPYPFLHGQYKPYYDMQLNIFAYRANDVNFYSLFK